MLINPIRYWRAKKALKKKTTVFFDYCPECLEECQYRDNLIKRESTITCTCKNPKCILYNVERTIPIPEYIEQFIEYTITLTPPLCTRRKDW